MNTASKGSIIKTDFGNIEGQDVYLFVLTNKGGNTVKITNYGGIVTGWFSTDKNGQTSSIVVGFEHLNNYLPNHPNFGALVGRYANRIAKGKFTLDGKEYTLAINNGENHLHGGIRNFTKVVWIPEIDNATNSLLLSYFSKDGEEGYPGNLSVSVSYRFTDDNELVIEYVAKTDKPTVVNLTSHCYFNLTGDVRNSVLDHSMQLNADNYTPVNEHQIPTGEIATVNGTPFDFVNPEKIGRRINEINGGYDHNYVLNNATINDLSAVVTEETSGRKLEIYTDQPGIQFYTGNSLDGTYFSDNGIPIIKQSAFCMETQHFPDSPNQPAFPSTVLNPGEQYHTITKYKLSSI